MKRKNLTILSLFLAVSLVTVSAFAQKGKTTRQNVPPPAKDLAAEKKAALERLQKLYSDPETIEAMYATLMEDGQKSYDEKNWDSAIQSFTSAIELKPNTADGYGWRGETYCLMNEYAKAIADLTICLKLAPQDAASYKQRGISYFKTADYGHAIDDLTKFIELSSDDSDYFYYIRGICFYKKAKFATAILDLDKAIKINFKNAFYYKMRAEIHRAMGNSKLADADEAARKKSPNYEDTL